MVDEKSEPKYGTVSGQPIGAVVGQAINAQLAALAQQSKTPARIKTITVYRQEKAVYAVSWESTGGAPSGTFAIAKYK